MRTIREVQELVARRYGITMREMLSAICEKRVARPRQVAMWIGRNMLFRTLEELGRNFDRDHTTVMHSVKRIDALMRQDSALAETVWTLARQVDQQHSALMRQARLQCAA